jgi:hypothetical protein
MKEQFVSDDGTIFDDRQVCRFYEETGYKVTKEDYDKIRRFFIDIKNGNVRKQQ